MSIQQTPSINVVDLHEFDKQGTSTIEVCVLWGSSVLHVSHINQNERFVLASENTIKDCNRFVVGSDVIGDLKEVPVVVNGQDGAKFIVNQEQLEIKAEERYLATFGNLTIVAKQVVQGKKIPRSRKHDKTMLITSLCSAIVVFATILATHFLVDINNSLLVQGNEEDRLNELRGFMQRQQERQQEQQTIPTENTQQGAASAAHTGPSGQMGNHQAPQRNTRRAIINNGEQPHLTRQAARDAVANRGIFAALGSPGGASGGSSGIVSPFGGMTESGPDNHNANGNLIGDSIGDAFGYNGLGPTGTGWGGGDRDEQTIGAGPLGTIGHDGNQRYGIDRGTNLRNRDRHGPIVRAAAPNVIGLLSPESIRRVVLRNLSQVTHCHEQGLIQNPSLEGRVVVRFAIGGNGTILASNVAESTLPEPSVAQCIAGAVRRWQFPTPEGNGVVIVNYPFNLQHPE